MSRSCECNIWPEDEACHHDGDNAWDVEWGDLRSLFDDMDRSNFAMFLNTCPNLGLIGVVALAGEHYSVVTKLDANEAWFQLTKGGNSG